MWDQKRAQNGAECCVSKNEKTGRKTAGFCVLERLQKRTKICIATALQNGGFGVANKSYEQEKTSVA
ncbi:MAG: hypothetical protein ACLTWO_01680 [Blautia massiliensis (ex Durand et al. 2017)]